MPVAAEIGRQGEDLRRVNRHATPVMGVPLAANSAKRILIVEDDATFAGCVSGLLADEGYEVASVSSGAAARARLATWQPRLVILDVGLPDGDGFEIAEELAAERRTAPVPVLFYSAHKDLAIRVRQSARPHHDFLMKPSSAQELLARVERCLSEAASFLELKHAASFDALTGLGNVRLLEERMAIEWARVNRYDPPLAVAMIDLDGLKAINDKHGHLIGSAVLRAVGDAVRCEIRDTDLAVRFGGDEFLVLLPHTTLVEGTAFGERLLGRIRALRPCGVAVSASAGVAAYHPQFDRSPQALLSRADAAVYHAKHQGGDQVTASDPAAPLPHAHRR